MRIKVADQTGFSMVEVTIAAGIFMILGAIAVKGFNRYNAYNSVAQARTAAGNQNDELLGRINRDFQKQAPSPATGYQLVSSNDGLHIYKPTSATSSTTVDILYQTSCQANSTGMRIANFSSVGSPCISCPSDQHPVVTITPAASVRPPTSYPAYQGHGTGAGSQIENVLAAAVCFTQPTAGQIDVTATSGIIDASGNLQVISRKISMANTNTSGAQILP